MTELAQNAIWCIAIVIGLIGWLSCRRYGKISAIVIGAFCFFSGLILGSLLMPALIIIASFLFTFLLCFQKTKDESVSFYAGLLVGVVSFIVLLALWNTIPISINSDQVLIEKIELDYIDSELGASGKFMLGYGSIEGAVYYKYGYRQGEELIENVIKKAPNIHIFDNQTNGRGTMYVYRTTTIRKPYPSPLNDIVFIGMPIKNSETFFDETFFIIQEGSISSGGILKSAPSQ